MFCGAKSQSMKLFFPDTILIKKDLLVLLYDVHCVYLDSYSSSINNKC